MVNSRKLTMKVSSHTARVTVADRTAMPANVLTHSFSSPPEPAPLGYR